MLITPIEFSNLCKKIQSTAENNSYSKIESSASEIFDQKRIATHRELSDELRQIERVVAERRRHISCVVGSFCGLRTIIGTIK